MAFDYKKEYKELFKTVAAELEGRVLTVNSAPYAVNIYGEWLFSNIPVS